MKNFYWLFGLLLISCNSHQVRVEGEITNAKNASLTLEKVQVGQNKKIDSTSLSSRGKFALTAQVPTLNEVFFQLRMDSLPPVLLLLSSAQKVHIAADAQDFVGSLQVSGNVECERLWQLQKRLWMARQKMDSLLQTDLLEQELQRQVNKLFVAQKQFNTTFIMKNLGSLTTAVAYYQKLGKQLPLFGDVGDRFLLSALLDSLKKQHPRSSYVPTLAADLKKLEDAASWQLLQERTKNVPAVSKPEIALRDVNGKEQSLNAITGKVVLLQFWSSRQPSQKLDNRELLNLHKEFADRPFQIYQVSLDTDSAAWANAVQQQGLKWTNVCSFRGTDCTAARNYNVSALPSNFLIDKKGEIIAKNLFDKDLQKRISQLLKQ
ncbi:hypothetical protein AGMMS4956_06170 [Bacteroidia bacterium]|nr:hypothetical protein AGMMS4956_06170 [Bacteroidia bacterium]